MSREISERIDKLETSINLILLKLDSIENGTSKMSGHIDFINEVYIKVQTPLYWICDRVNYLKAYKIYTTGLNNSTGNIESTGNNTVTKKISGIDINEQD